MPPVPTPLAMTVAADALLGMLLPFWRLVISTFVVFVVAASLRRLVRRGPSRMATALLVTGGAIVGLAVLGVLLDDW